MAAQSRPTSVTVRDVRSVWGPPLEVPVGAHVTALVGPNRAGSTTLLFALAAAHDPGVAFVPDRDLPRRRDGQRRSEGAPHVEVTFDDQTSATVSWDVHRGTRTVEGPFVEGNVVLAQVADTPRDLLRAARIDGHDESARRSLASHVRDVARALLPEVATVEVDDELMVRVRDDTGVLLPVPQTRTMTALGLALHLAEAGTPVALVGVEAPEAFLHPAAQEALARLLTEIAGILATPVVVATSSPFVLPRVATTTVVALARDAIGRTRVVGSAAGDRPQAELLGGLLRDTGLAAVLDRRGQVPADARAVLITEGGTDVAYLSTVARVLGREPVLDGVVLLPAGGAMGAALAAIVLRAEVDVPLVVLLDHDDAGRRARDTLVSRFEFDRSRQVVTYADVVDGVPPGVDAEALFATELVRRFVALHGETVSAGERTYGQLVHVLLTSSGKSEFVPWVAEHAEPDDLTLWNDLLDLLEERLP